MPYNRVGVGAQRFYGQSLVRLAGVVCRLFRRARFFLFSSERLLYDTGDTTYFPRDSVFRARGQPP